MTLYRIEAPAFVAGFVVTNGRVADTAPIVSYLRGWTPERVRAHGERRRWKVVAVPPPIGPPSVIEPTGPDRCCPEPGACRGESRAWQWCRLPRPFPPWQRVTIPSPRLAPVPRPRAGVAGDLKVALSELPDRRSRLVGPRDGSP